MDHTIFNAASRPLVLPDVTSRRQILRLYVHTAASSDTSVLPETIERWHRARGFRTIGYHAVITHDLAPLGAALYWGRAPGKIGAHVKGDNARTLGVCVTGHGDRFFHTPAQRVLLLQLLAAWCVAYRLLPSNVLGHREVVTVDAKLNPRKTCPGKLIDMDEIRAQLADTLMIMRS